MEVNVRKTKAMVVSKDKGIVVNIMVDGQKVEQVQNSNSLDHYYQKMGDVWRM